MKRFSKKDKRNKRINLLSVKQAALAVKKNSGQVFLIITGLFVFILAAWNLNSFILAAEYFNITEIEVIGRDPVKVDYSLARMKGASNIFKADLKQIASSIEREYPDIQKAIVKRVLPNKLIVEVLRRKPVAQVLINSGRQPQVDSYLFTINDEAYILANVGTKSRKNLPVIYGCGLSIAQVQIGRSCITPGLKSALSFLKEAKISGILNDYIITKVDASEPRSLSFFINGTLEVKIGDRNWKEKIENLAGILENMDIDYSQDYYIDLRFKDFVFGKK